MIERQFVSQKIKEFEIQQYVKEELRGVGLSHVKIQRTPLGEKIIVFSSKPGLIIGKKGQNIKKLTQVLKKKFGLENPQIETAEVDNKYLDPEVAAEEIVSALEKYGTQRFKAIGHKMMENIMDAGAKGVEITIAGKVPSARAKCWRFHAGYLKKCGDLAIEGVKRAYMQAKLKAGTIGIKVSIMPPDLVLPDEIAIKEEKEEQEEKAPEVKDKVVEEKNNEKKEKAEKKTPRKRTAKTVESSEDKKDNKKDDKKHRKSTKKKNNSEETEE